MNEAERAALQVLASFAESSTALAAFVGIVGIFRLHVLDERQHDAESEVRLWLKRLMKRETFVASFADVQKWLWDEQSRVAGPPHQEFLTAALSANHRRERLVPIRRRTRRTMLALMGWHLGMAAAATFGLSHATTLAGTRGFSRALWVAAAAQLVVPLWCVWVWTTKAEFC